MAEPNLRERDVDALLGSGSLRVGGSFQWAQKSNVAYATMIIPVAGSTAFSVRLVLTVNLLDPKHRSFVLLVNDQRVRGLDMDGSHSNKHTNDEVWVDRTHKHKWTDACLGRFAYTPTDITGTDFQTQLDQFCNECGITGRASISEAPSRQGDLFDEV